MYFRKKLRQPLFHLILIPFCIIWIYPFVWMLFSSLKSNPDYIGAGLRLLPRTLHWDNYERAWNIAHFSAYFKNSLVITVCSVLIVLLVSSLAGYALGRGGLPGRKWMLLSLGAIMFIPKGYTIIPVFQLVKHLGLLNTIPGVILAESSGAHVIYILLFMSYFGSLPHEVEEAAEVDGAGFVRTFGQIMLPLSKPIMATTGIMQFIFTWNSFFVPLVFTLNKPELRTLAVGMYAFVGENSVDYSGMAAGAAIAIVPIIVVFVCFQRYFVEGIAGSVKG